MVWELNGKERDELEMSFAAQGDEELDTINVWAGLVALSVRGENGRRLFSGDDVERLGTKSAQALNRVVEVAQRLSGISEKELEEIAEDFRRRPERRFSFRLALELGQPNVDRMLMAMGSHLVAEWRAFFIVENEVTPEDEEAAQMDSMDLSEQAKTNLAKRLSKRKAR